MYIITEWDDSTSLVSAYFVRGSVLITYPDGVTHKVSGRHFWYELRAQPAPEEVN